MYETKLLTISIDFTRERERKQKQPKLLRIYGSIVFNLRAVHAHTHKNSVMINLIVRLPFHPCLLYEKINSILSLINADFYLSQLI